MLNQDALAQLSQLKKVIHESRDIADGTVRGTNNRYGFVNLDDGRDAFLAPDIMNQVLPGDRVTVCVTTNDKGKLDAALEKLLSSELKTFVGRYVEKGKNHFVAADAPQLSRWFFVPPKERKKFKHDDMVCCQITRHPFGDGKAQVKITQHIGHSSEPGIERRFLIAKFDLITEWPEAALEQAKAISEQPISLPEHYHDLRDLPFVTIDAETTQDMDDALYIESADSGWTLYSAIADPSALIPEKSPLDESAQLRGCSAYLAGGTLSMFPRELSEGTFSLQPAQDRLALVCKMSITSDGTIAASEFMQGMIRSQQKLSYAAVAAFLASNGSTTSSTTTNSNSESQSFDADTQQLLLTLSACAQQRFAYRRAHCITHDDNVDYFYHLNAEQKIESISKRKTTAAHQIVEEAMLATNQSAGKFLAEHGAGKSLFSTHAGFRAERLPEIEQWLKKDKPDMTVGDLTQLEAFGDLMRQLQTDSDDATMLASLKRLLQASEMAATPAPHYGLGFNLYAMITSPIRRYQDLHNHRVIKALLTQQTPSTDSATLATQLQTQLSKVRQVSRQLDQWLLRHYLADKTGQVFTAHVMAVSNQGVAVRLDDSGAEGFIVLRGSKEQPAKYDSIRMRLTVDEATYSIEQAVDVRLDKVDWTQQQLQFSLVADTTVNS